MINVMVIDDSAVVRQVFSEMLNTTPDIRVSDVAGDPYIAARKLRKRVPDVIILDIEMPNMDGLTFLKKLMSQHPLPVVICSSLTQDNSKLALDALHYGAVEVIEKPRIDVKKYLHESRILIGDAIRSAAQVKPVRRKTSTDDNLRRKKRPSNKKSILKTTQQFWVIGASTGGTTAIEQILMELPADSPGIVIVQHMPKQFTKTFSTRLNHYTNVEVREASHNDTIMDGLVLIAPGNAHTKIARSGTRYYVRVVKGELVCRHRPSVDVLFNTAAKSAGANCSAMILTGMGRDGAEGMKKLYKAGAYTIAQDERSSTVYGMPKACVEAGVIHEVVDLKQMARKIIGKRNKVT
ncbi:MAG: protein-glutamate methylesterase/protein-glutamine glutaminase [Bacteroidota bacterium]